MNRQKNIKYQVFISSTYEDLIQVRNEITLNLLDVGCIPVGMEQFPASSISQMEYIEKMFQTTDFIVLIIAGRYGSIDKDSGVSYTESEIQLAKKMKIPILVFMLNENEMENLPGKYLESDPILKEKLNLFRNSFEQTLINFYSRPIS